MDILNAMPNAIAQGMIWGIMAIGLFISYKILDFADLTVDGSICTGGAVCAILILQGVNPWVALLVSFITGLGCGLITGLFNTLMGIPPILAGILTQLMLYSINLKILGGANLSISSRNFNLVVTVSEIGVSIGILFGFFAVIIGILYYFFGTEIGRSIRATGSNIKMAKAQGINTKLCKVMGLMISNAIVALAGGLLAQYQGYADVSMGRGAIVIGLAAIIIGGALLSKISRHFAFKLLSVLVGGIIYFIVYQIVISLGLDTDLLKMLSAIIVAIFLAIPYWQKKIGPHLKKKAPKHALATSNGEVVVEETGIDGQNNIITDNIDHNEDLQNLDNDIAIECDDNLQDGKSANAEKEGQDA